MSSLNKTPALELNQWAGTDYVLREDFNADNLKVDTAVGGLRTGAASARAGLRALQYDLCALALSRRYDGAETMPLMGCAADAFTDGTGVAAFSDVGMDVWAHALTAGGLSQPDIDEGVDPDTGTAGGVLMDEDADDRRLRSLSRRVAIAAPATLTAIVLPVGVVYTTGATITAELYELNAAGERAGSAAVSDAVTVSAMTPGADQQHPGYTTVTLDGFGRKELRPGWYELRVGLDLTNIPVSDEVPRGTYLHKTAMPVNGDTLDPSYSFHVRLLFDQSRTWEDAGTVTTVPLSLRCAFDELKVHVRSRDADVEADCAVDGGAWVPMTAGTAESVTLPDGTAAAETCFTAAGLEADAGSTVALRFTLAPAAGKSRGTLLDYGAAVL